MKFNYVVRDTYPTTVINHEHGTRNQERLPIDKISISIEGTESEILKVIDKLNIPEVEKPLH